MIGGLGVWELLLIFGIVLLLFGGKRLPGIASGLGGAINNFKKAMKDGKDDDTAAPPTLEAKPVERAEDKVPEQTATSSESKAS